MAGYDFANQAVNRLYGELVDWHWDENYRYSTPNESDGYSIYSANRDRTYTLLYQVNSKGEKVPYTTKHFIIIGTSGAAEQPRKHSTYREAEIEARRLSVKHPGETFTIFESKADFTAPAPNVNKNVHY